jgi:hypothetical protein
MSAFVLLSGLLHRDPVMRTGKDSGKVFWAALLRCETGDAAFQFDWSEDWAIVGGERIKLQVAHFKLLHSRAFFLTWRKNSKQNGRKSSRG